MDRAYPSRINWENEPSISTPINDTNLNKMDSALYTIDGRVIDLDNNKAGKNETFNTSRNGVVPKPTQADITNEKVLRADGVWVEQSGGGGGGGGHTYVDKDDEQMPQRGKAKFTGGLNLTDDSENNRTIVDDEYEIIPWTTWQGYSDAEKSEHPNAIVTGAPDCDGTLEIENLHLAWSNSNPTSSFSAQSITLDTVGYGEYDKIRVEGKLATGDATSVSVDFDKTDGYACLTFTFTGSTNTSVRRRQITNSGNNTLTFGGAYFQVSGLSPTADDTQLIPLRVYVYKKNLTAKIKAIAHDVSTSASNCMMSDEQTSVEDALSYSTTEHIVGKWIDGSTLYEKTVDCGALPNATSKNVAHGISNLKKIVKYGGYAYSTINVNSIPMPFATNTTFARVNSNGSSYLAISTGSDLSSYNETYITIRYTKTS